MRIGLFFGQLNKDYRIPELLQAIGDDIVGYHSLVPYEILSEYNFVANSYELLAGCDTALVYSNEGSLCEIPRNAIRKGVNLFLADLPSLSDESLSELSALSQEINTIIEFGFSGLDLSNYAKYVNELQKPLFVDCRRNLLKDSSFKSMQKVIIYDLATLFRLQGGMVKKLRAISFPVSASEYDLLNIRIEFVNRSVFCYTINRMVQDEIFNMNAYGNYSKDLISISIPHNPLHREVPYDVSPYSPGSFINSLRYGYKQLFSLPNALEVKKIYKEIDQMLGNF